MYAIWFKSCRLFLVTRSYLANPLNNLRTNQPAPFLLECGFLLPHFKPVMIENIPLLTGQKYTIYTISEMMATTQRKEVIIDNLYPEPQHHPRFTGQHRSPSGTWKYGGYREHRGRKVFHLTLRPSQDIIIPSWGHLDSDLGAYGSFSGNACLNLAGSVEEVRQLMKKNINSNFCRHDIVLACPVPWTEGEYQEVFSESDTDHAVILQKRSTTQVTHD